MFVLYRYACNVMNIHSKEALFPGLPEGTVGPRPLRARCPHPPAVISGRVGNDVLCFPTVFNGIQVNPLSVLLFLVCAGRSAIARGRRSSFTTFFRIKRFNFHGRFVHLLCYRNVFLSFSVTMGAFAVGVSPRDLFLVGVSGQEVSNRASIPRPDFRVAIGGVKDQIMGNVPASHACPRVAKHVFLCVLSVAVKGEFLIVFLTTVGLCVMAVVTIRPQDYAGPRRSI